MQSLVGTVSGDLLVKDAMLPSDTVSGDILMSTSTGAYTFAMASNYNRVPKSGVIAVTNSGVVELVNRQSFQDTLLTICNWFFPYKEEITGSNPVAP